MSHVSFTSLRTEKGERREGGRGGGFNSLDKVGNQCLGAKGGFHGNNVMVPSFSALSEIERRSMCCLKMNILISGSSRGMR